MKFTCWICTLVAALALAHSLSAEQMNDIDFSKYQGFEKKWKLVTVRYRTDTREMRVTYANDIAAKALKANSKDYPDGAVFAKIGLATQDDPAFTSSRVPSGAQRFQFMVRDKKKYATTGGWGYALFGMPGIVFKETPIVQQSMACYACHQIVHDRGDVFSQFANLSSFPSGGPSKISAELKARLEYENIATDQLPEYIRERFDPSLKTVRAIKGLLTKSVFQGTIDEIRPSLLDEARRTGEVIVFAPTDKTQFAMVVPQLKARSKVGGKCLDGKAMTYMQVWTMAPVDPAGHHLVSQTPVCD